MNARQAFKLSEQSELNFVLGEIRDAANSGEYQTSLSIESVEAADEIAEQLEGLGYRVSKEMTAHTMVLTVAWIKPVDATMEW